MELTADQKAKALKKIILYRKDPVLFAGEVLGIDSYWSKQKDIMQSVADHKYTSVGSGHDVGKSFCAADIALWFLFTHTPSIVITTAPTWRQVEKVLWGEIASHYNKSKIFLGGKLLETEIKIGPKWYAIGFSSDAPDSFQGFHEENILVIVDEPSGVDDKVAVQIMSIMANKNARLLYIGNPTQSTGFFAESLRPGSKFNRIFINCWESPNVVAGKILYPALVTKEWCEERRDEWGEDSPMYVSRVLGQVPTETADTLIKLGWIEQSHIRHDKSSYQRHTGQIEMGVDVARFGDNSTVFVVRQGRRVIDVVSYRGFDLMRTVGKVQELSDKYKPTNIIIDDNGVGGGVTDRLMELGFPNIVPVNGGESADDPNKFINRRAELAWRVREAFRQNELDIAKSEEKLAFECNNQFYEHTSDFKLKVMSKTILKRKGLKSPDFFDALCLSFARTYPGSLQKNIAQYLSEFHDAVHILDIDKKLLEIGTSRFCYLIPMLNGQSFLLWCTADRKGMVYFYKERVIERATSSEISRTIREAEVEDREVDLRYTKKIYFNPEDSDARYNLIEQLEDEGFYFEEVEHNEEIAGMNLREGLRFDKSKPVNNQNHPFVLFSPACVNTIRAVKYYLSGVNVKNDPLYEAAHAAVSVAILTEPIWLSVYKK